MWRYRVGGLTTVVLLVSGCALAPRSAGTSPEEIVPRLESPTDISAWVLDGSGDWVISNGKLVLQSPGTPGGPFRRPAALAVIRSGAFQRASVRAEVRSTAPAGLPQRDLQVIAAYQSPSHFYYIHLSGVTDAVHNGIFLVAEDDRRRIDDGRAPPLLVDQEWHHVRLEFDGVAGALFVYVDGSSEPVLQAADRTLRHGQVGFGSFDDTGEFRNIRVIVRQ